MITSEQIARAKQQTSYTNPTEIRHEHDDCIRIAYEWLDAQDKARRKLRHPFPIKHIIERWAGRYVSQSDVEVAAAMHPGIWGTYPYFNITSKLVEPSVIRLDGVEEAFKHEMHPSNSSVYGRKE